MKPTPAQPETTDLILASASPRRRELLGELPIRFNVIPCTYNEPPFDFYDTSNPESVAKQIAAFKANCVAEQYPDHWVLGADTLVACNGELLGKPHDLDDARRMLILQAEYPSVVITGLMLVRHGANPEQYFSSASTTVWMRNDPEAREEYLQSEDWRDKAGAYGIQTTGDALVQRIEGSFSNVVGLPLRCTAELLCEAGLLSASEISHLAD